MTYFDMYRINYIRELHGLKAYDKRVNKDLHNDEYISKFLNVEDSNKDIKVPFQADD